MIEELKQLLDVIKELPELAVWSVLGFGIYKLVVYLSTTGSIVFILKLAIEKLHDIRTRPPHDPKPVMHVYSFKSLSLIGDAEAALNDALLQAIRRAKSSNSIYRYVHLSDITPVIEALNAIETRADKK